MAQHEEDARQEIQESRCSLYDDATRREHIVRAVEHLEATHRDGEGDYRRQIDRLKEDWNLND
jgi:hypothetical protein